MRLPDPDQIRGNPGGQCCGAAVAIGSIDSRYADDLKRRFDSGAAGPYLRCCIAPSVVRRDRNSMVKTQ
jgi:hypothetical protein